MLISKLLWKGCMIALCSIVLAGGAMHSCEANGTNTSSVKNSSASTGELQLLDGPGMVNTSYWKHEVLNGDWMAPEGDLALKISGFDYEFGVYKSGEPDNFRWLKARFYFDGSQKSQNRLERFDLKLSGEPRILAADGAVSLEIIEMWHEKKSVFVKVKFPKDENCKVRELRNPDTFRE